MADKEVKSEAKFKDGARVKVTDAEHPNYNQAAEVLGSSPAAGDLPTRYHLKSLEGPLPGKNEFSAEEGQLESAEHSPRAKKGATAVTEVPPTRSHHKKPAE